MIEISPHSTRIRILYLSVGCSLSSRDDTALPIRHREPCASKAWRSTQAKTQILESTFDKTQMDY
ncbi:hypothetical protein NYG90_08530 [Helicobacter sp. XJK30-2]|uniref:Uncharacterized protein n=1 Tax=Helicobacter zhangjianzhongii TaxID=2974574 RepID=A0ACC6FTX7_9HELI|nr:hypothetical protein [Helicobacter sp. XJK30-2]MDL0082710.1 hypothetical protein [Helicobacter sp. XJK30-2]